MGKWIIAHRGEWSDRAFPISLSSLEGAFLKGFGVETELRDFKNEFYVAPSYEYLIENNQELTTFSIGKHEVGVHGLGTPSDLDNFLKHEKLEEVLGKINP